MSTLSQASRRAAASIGVIGAGIFGVSIALELSGSGFAVSLYEKSDDILTGATARNLFRVHRGYHYPRDLDTAHAARDGYVSFAQTFGAAFATAVPHHYAIASTSRTTAEQFEAHCEMLGISARPVAMPDLVPGSASACYEVDEAYYDAGLLRRIAWERLEAARVSVVLRYPGPARQIARAHDFVVVAVYGALNEVLRDLQCPPIQLQYELCEVPVVHTPGMNQLSLVVLDGPFVSVAPYGDDHHILYDVVYSVHRRYVGYSSPFPAEDVRTPVSHPARTKFRSILASTQRFLAPLANARHVGSLVSQRVIVPGVEETDARPTVVTWASPTVISVLSGKVCTSVETGRLVAARISARTGQAVDGAVLPRQAAAVDGMNLV